MWCYSKIIDADLPPSTTHLAQVADLGCGWRRISISVGVSEARAAALFSSLQSQIG